ncbi:MAG: ribonuclease III [Desulfobacteraceae bacterium]|nr:ribonuclease III [Desulfobacteraceae bacterium]
MTDGNYKKLEAQLGYQFKNDELITEALRHSSFVNEQVDKTLRDNERFEFLGDAVLNLVVGHMLMQHDPNLHEGDLSRIRANLVNEYRLAEMARELDVGSHLQLGKGEEMTNGREKSSILADAFEALTAAIYLDGGFDRVAKVLASRFSTLIDDFSALENGYDYKSRLQEYVQVSHQEIPKYRVIDETGPDHDKTFTVAVDVCGITADGVGKSKKLAEQQAARAGLHALRKPGDAT